jgi:hypothetical protein
VRISFGELLVLGSTTLRRLSAELILWGSVGVTVGAASGWCIGLVSKGLGKTTPGVAEAVGWGTGAGAFFAIVLVIFNRTL